MWEHKPVYIKYYYKVPPSFLSEEHSSRLTTHTCTHVLVKYTCIYGETVMG